METLTKGAEHPFVIWTDHNNLTYLRTAKRLNAHQARWSLFHARFNVSVSYNHIPASSGETVIITIFNRFFKLAHRIALKKLSSAAETAKLLTDHVFRLHGILVEIMSDQGSRFTSQVWRSFCSALGGRVSLSSGYHSQTSSQTEHMKQELEATLCCLTFNNPSTWSSYLL